VVWRKNEVTKWDKLIKRFKKLIKIIYVIKQWTPKLPHLQKLNHRSRDTVVESVLPNSNDVQKPNLRVAQIVVIELSKRFVPISRYSIWLDNPYTDGKNTWLDD